MHSSAISEPDLVDCETQEPAHAATALHYAQLMLSWRMRHANKDLTHLVVTDQGLVEREGAGRQLGLASRCLCPTRPSRSCDLVV